MVIKVKKQSPSKVYTKTTKRVNFHVSHYGIELIFGASKVLSVTAASVIPRVAVVVKKAGQWVRVIPKANN